MKEAESVETDQEHTLHSAKDKTWGRGDEYSLAILRLSRLVPHVEALARESEGEEAEVA